MSKSAETDPSLLRRIRDAKDERAWELFLEIYSPLVLGYLRRVGLQDADAADVAQEALRAVVPAIRKFKYDPQAGSFRGWLFAVVRSKLRDHLAKGRRPDRAKGGSGVMPLLQRQSVEEDSELWDREFRQRLLVWASDQVRQSVRESTWEAFRQTAIEGKPPKLVADELGLSVGAVYLAKSRFMERVKKQIAELQLE
jgi:RNA polymerase sigma-70 factor (ECF subfamily)